MALLPVSLTAQAYLSIPQGIKSAIAAGIDFPADAKGYSLMGLTTVGGSAYVGASSGIISYDSDFDIENEKQVGAFVGFEVPSLLQTASVCPQVGINYSVVEDLNMVTIPVGVGVGRTLPLGEGGATLTSHITPQLMWARLSADGVDETASDTYFVTTAGATVGFGQFLLGAVIGKVFEEGYDVMFGIRAGFGF